MFFDEYSLFRETSVTASSASRLNLRYQAMIAANEDILKGARVLDLASHDGRWSFAALKAGAASVVGVEARPSLVTNAISTFEAYNVPKSQYRFIRGDMFRVLQNRDLKADVVLCLGFVYHTLRYGELFLRMMETGAHHCIVDTKVIRRDEPLVRVNVNRTSVQSNAAPDKLSHRRRAIGGWPSVSALELMLGVYDFEVEERYDWPALLKANPDAPRNAAADYRSGQRVTLRCRAR